MKIVLIARGLTWLLIELTIVSGFEVYWNIPSFMCKKHQFDFTSLVKNYDILQNEQDNFQGEKITILYDPGMFPALGTNNEKRNGGIPQEGNLTKHLTVYRQHIEELVPDINNNGLVIIDFESWRPIFRQNFGTLTPYKDVSYQIEKQRHPFWPKPYYEAEAVKRFESAGRKYVEETLKLSKLLRPYAKWGYYAFPYCFNKGQNAFCPREVKAENDRMGWMFFHSDMVLPSVYLNEKMKPQERQSMVSARIQEAIRASKSYSRKQKEVYVYIRYVYTDSRKVLSESDLLMVFQSAKSQGANGIILWGSSYDLSSRNRNGKALPELPETQEILTDDDSENLFSQSLSLSTVWAKLYFLPNPKVSVFELRNNKAWIGRDAPSNESTENIDVFVFHDQIPSKYIDRISKCHFTIEREPKESNSFCARESSEKDMSPATLSCAGRNGIFINDEKLLMGEKRMLAHNDIIKLSNYELFRFHYENTPSELHTLPKSCLSKYYIGMQIGSGGCGIVRLIQNLKTSEKFAMKVIRKEINPMVLNRVANNSKILNEVKIMKKLSHFHVLSLIDTFETPECVYIVMEYMEGRDLLHRITQFDPNRKYLSEKDAKFFFLQICRGLKYLHDSFVTHRDIKPDNILLASNDADPLVKISDFGLSKFVALDSMQTVCGTQLYVAPEVLMGGVYTSKVDMWSLGVLLFAMLSGSVPFCDAYGPPDVTTQIKEAKYSFKSRLWNDVSRPAKDLIRKLIQKEPEKRLTIDEVLSHPWLKCLKTISRVQKLYNFNETVVDETEDAELETTLLRKMSGKEKRSSKKKKDEYKDGDEETEKPNKMEFKVAKWLRKNVQVKKTKFLNHNVEYFASGKALDALMSSKFAEGENCLFQNRQSAIDYLDLMLTHKFFHRAKKVPVSEHELKGRSKERTKDQDKDRDIKIKETDAESSHAEEKAEKSEVAPEKKKRKIRLEMHPQQIFIDQLHEPYVWIYDPIPMHYWIFGTLVVIGAIVICLFPLWPPQLRTGVYYLSMTAAGFLVFLLALVILRFILFCIIWIVSGGKHHFWFLPNLTEDVGFIDSFKPLYKHEYKDGSENKKHKKDKTKKKKKESDDEDAPQEKSNKKSKNIEIEEAEESELRQRKGGEVKKAKDEKEEEVKTDEVKNSESESSDSQRSSTGKDFEILEAEEDEDEP
ncbi:CLUMA_CG014053, isoform A [Clunio marinus]|uniref:Translocation protein SEC62 n=1 Tax=Clunio marinus TaxID=568069 RepID=A0A1J1IM31_9DIPT|nr:CLUMA_CG014053, isoform A [Clunio marinus]